MVVKLLSHTPEPEKLIAIAAKNCYSKTSIDEIEDNLTEESIEKFINMLVSVGHSSPLEHVTFTFGVEGVSRVLLAQLTRHRMASFSVASQRYIELEQFEYVIPKEIEAIPEAKEIFIKAMEQNQKDYDTLTDILLKQQDDGNIKKSIEDARYVLPNACATRIVFTMNIRSLYNFFEHRCCNRAQLEIRDLANEMLDLCKKVSPILFKTAGAKCEHGKCTEGKMSCGNPIKRGDK